MLVAHKTSRALVYGIGTQFYILIFRQHTMINNPIERQSNLPPPNVGRGKLTNNMLAYTISWNISTL